MKHFVFSSFATIQLNIIEYAIYADVVKVYVNRIQIAMIFREKYKLAGLFIFSWLCPLLSDQSISTDTSIDPTFFII